MLTKRNQCKRCGEPARKQFCSQACYHTSYHDGSYVQNRCGQRRGRKAVAKVFPLQSGHVVHHVDRNDFNNSLDNLWVFASQADHMSFHKGGTGQPIWKGDEQLSQVA